MLAVRSFFWDPWPAPLSLADILVAAIQSLIPSREAASLVLVRGAAYLGQVRTLEVA